MKQRLIADSGGTKTDWCWIKPDGTQQFFSTDSYHPANWSESFWVECKKFWATRSDLLSAKLLFFGAGCFKQELAQELHTQFEKMGFEDIEVKSDLHAAGLATLNEEEGWVAIMGTGSVLFKWKHQEVLELVGGKGYLEGDEGSGFYFGKLVYDAYVNNQLTSQQVKLFKEKVNLHELQACKQSGNEKYIFATLPRMIGDLPEFALYHNQNFRLFYEKHLLDSDIRLIQVVGSYGAKYRDYLKSVLAENQVEIGKVVGRPIEGLVEQMGLDID